MDRYIDAFYDFLNSIGYLHPIHPAMVHMPIGLLVGAIVFIYIAVGVRYRHFRFSGHHALALALIFWFPTVLFGIMDWQRYLGGAWLFTIKLKLALGAPNPRPTSRVSNWMRRTPAICEPLVYTWRKRTADVRIPK